MLECSGGANETATAPSSFAPNPFFLIASAQSFPEIVSKLNQ
jgi:hypothetical protein